MFRKLSAILLTLVAVLAAGWLALRRSDIPYDTLEHSYAVDTSRFLTLSGDLKIHYVDAGPRDAPVLVLLHGYAASLNTWLPWQARLSDAYRVIAVDLPGHGLSRSPADAQVDIGYMTDTVDAFADKLGLEQFSLAGSSLGGNVAWQYALSNPHRVDSLILVDASGWKMADSDAGTSPIIFRLLRNPVARLVMKDLDMSELIEDGLRKAFVDQDFVTSQMTERYSALSRAPGHRKTLLQLAAGEADRVAASRETLGGLTVPTLILWGAQDNLVPVEHAGKFEAAIPNAVSIIYDQAGHLPQEEVADESAADVRAFLDRYAAQDFEDELLPTALSENPQTGMASGGGQRPR